MAARQGTEQDSSGRADAGGPEFRISKRVFNCSAKLNLPFKINEKMRV